MGCQGKLNPHRCEGRETGFGSGTALCTSCEDFSKLSLEPPILHLDNGVLVRSTWKSFNTLSHCRVQLWWLILFDNLTGSARAKMFGET